MNNETMADRVARLERLLRKMHDDAQVRGVLWSREVDAAFQEIAVEHMEREMVGFAA